MVSALQLVQDDPFHPLSEEHPLAPWAQTINSMVGGALERLPDLEANQLQQLRTIGWILLSSSLSGATRDTIVAQSRLLIKKDPLARNAARIWEAYVIGEGMNWTVTSKSERGKNVNLLRDFWNSPKNRAALKFQAQRESYKALLADGETHFILFFGPRGTVPIIRAMKDSLEFRNPLTHPEDKSQTIYHVRTHTPVEYDFTDQGPVVKPSTDQKVQYIRAWDADLSSVQSSGISPPEADILKGAVCLRVTVNEEAGRGWPHNEPAIDWVRSFKGFMEDRVTISRALARFAWQLKGKGSEAQLEGMISRLENVASDADIRRGHGVGKTIGVPENVDMKPIKTETGGSSARADARLIRQQVGAGVGITEPNLTGDPSVGNLASLTAMDGVMARNFQTDQMLMRETWRDLLSAVLTRGKSDPRVIEDAIGWARDYLDIDYPAIVTEAVEDTVTAIIAAAVYLPPDWVTRQLLTTLGEKNIEQVLKDEKDRVAQLPPDDPELDPDGDEASVQ